MLHNQLLHKLKTNSGYITALFILHFCALFYFSFQTISTMIAEDEDILFPYDLMCIADDDDDDFFAELEENYDVEMTTYPMVRVTSFDSTEGQDSMYQAQTIQGQHIGISESTYHALKKNWILLMKQKI